jgi:K+-transporting ATPase A subunit
LRRCRCCGFAAWLTCYWAEAQPNPLLKGVDQHVAMAGPAQSPGGNMEGKEVRFGVANSALFATVTTDASCGAVNSMHDSFMPLGGMVPLVNMMMGEVIFGGVGSGMYGMLILVIVTVFIAGLMVGRTPEYLGKKVQAYEVQLSMLYVLIFPLIILGFAAVSCCWRRALGTSSLANHGPAWIVGNSVCIHLGSGEQWIGVCRAECEHALVQLDAGDHNADRPLPDDSADAGGGGQVLRPRRLRRRRWACSQ